MTLENTQRCDNCNYFDSGWSPSWENKLGFCKGVKYDVLRTKEEWTPIQALRNAGLNETASLLEAGKIESCFEEAPYQIISIGELLNR